MAISAMSVSGMAISVMTVLRVGRRTTASCSTFSGEMSVMTVSVMAQTVRMTDDNAVSVMTDDHGCISDEDLQ
jgi:hypothetical protein